MIAQYKPVYEKEERDAIKAIADTDSWFAEFTETEAFEKEIAKTAETVYCSAVNNGTIAISLALLAQGIKPGDEVIVPTLTMIATATAVSLIGAKPVFADVGYDTLCLSYDSVRQIISNTPNIKGLVYVTLNGRFNVVEYKQIQDLCYRKNIKIIKDDAQSFGSRSSEGKSLQDSSYGEYHTLSFSPHKIISCGQGGAILTYAGPLHDAIEELKDFGRLSGGVDKHPKFGINSKFTEIQATFGLAQLKKIEQKKKKKIEIYESYYSKLKDLNIMIQLKLNQVPWFMDVYVQNRRELIDFLKANGIQTRPMYPCIHQEFYDTKQFLPTAELLSQSGLWLPSSFDLTHEEITYICNKIKEFHQK